MKCPFKKIIKNQKDMFGVEWLATEEFDECIGEECAAYKEVFISYYPNKQLEEICMLCNK